MSYDGRMETEKINKNLELLTCAEVAKMLKVQISTIYSWISYGQLPCDIYRKLGRKPIFIKDEVIKWFMAGAKLKKRQRKGEKNEYEKNFNR